MSTEHKRPLFAFVLVAVACALILANAVRSEAVRGMLRDGAHRVVAGVELAFDEPAQPAATVVPPRSRPFDRIDHAPRPAHASTPPASVPVAPAPATDQAPTVRQSPARDRAHPASAPEVVRRVVTTVRTTGRAAPRTVQKATRKTSQKAARSVRHTVKKEKASVRPALSVAPRAAHAAPKVVGPAKAPKSSQSVVTRVVRARAVMGRALGRAVAHHARPAHHGKAHHGKAHHRPHHRARHHR